MGKRQQRYQQPFIDSSINNVVGKMGHIMLNTNQVFSGIIKNIDSLTIQLQVTGSKRLALPRKEVIEIIIDFHSPNLNAIELFLLKKLTK